VKAAQKQKVICLMGPTASGKTDIAIDWVDKYPCEIISVDSALIYRGMDIGTAKPDPATLIKAPHRLIDIREPTQRYSAAEFCTDVVCEIEDIVIRGRTPLLVGGTMLYYQALQQGLAPLPAADPAIRRQLEEDTVKVGSSGMHQRLAAIDSVAAKRIKPGDSQRIQRALEVYLLTGKPISELQQQTMPWGNYQFINIALLPDDRPQLHRRIATRFHHMIDHGFIEEVIELKNHYALSLDLPAMRSVGYRQIWEYLDGLYGKDVMIEKAIAATRQLAKRQLTWLRHWPNVQRYPALPKGLF